MSIDQAPGVRLEITEHIARITLDRPERHNALEASDVAGILSAFDEIDAREGVRVLLLTGSGERTFCSGASLDQMGSGEMSGRVFDTMTDRLADLRVPTVCALNGNVYGGGAELALCCDFRIGIEGMRLRVPAARLGVCYPVGGLTRYVQRLGPGVASRILLAAEEMEGAELHRVGFLTELVASDRLADVVDARVEQLARLAPLAVQGMKRIMRGIEAGALDAKQASAIIERCNASDDQQEGIRAWKERRDPEFRGR